MKSQISGLPNWKQNEARRKQGSSHRQSLWNMWMAALVKKGRTCCRCQSWHMMHAAVHPSTTLAQPNPCVHAVMRKLRRGWPRTSCQASVNLCTSLHSCPLTQAPANAQARRSKQLTLTRPARVWFHNSIHMCLQLESSKSAISSTSGCSMRTAHPRKFLIVILYSSDSHFTLSNHSR